MHPTLTAKFAKFLSQKMIFALYYLILSLQKEPAYENSVIFLGTLFAAKSPLKPLSCSINVVN